MPQYVLIIAYDGTRFHGFQRQHGNHDNASSTCNIEGMKKRPRIDKATGQRLPMTTADNKHVTVQECLESAILQWLSSISSNNNSNNDMPAAEEQATWTLESLNLRVAGRTDKGVHARGQVVAIQLPEFVKGPEWTPLWKIQRAIHGRLPDDISVRRVFAVNPSQPLLFDPRQNAKLKQYSYTIKYQRKYHSSSSNSRKSNHDRSSSTAQEPEVPTSHIIDNNNSNSSNLFVAVGSQTFRSALDDSPCCWLCHDPLDDSLLPTICQSLQGTHDYSAFVHKRSRDDKDNTLTVSRMTFEILQEYQPPSLYVNDSNEKEGTTITTTTNNHNDNYDEPQIVLGRLIVEGQRFRRSMVRNLVGFAVDVCRGKQTLDNMDSIWNCTKQGAARVQVAPACGLCLEFVKF